jgi:hypothetical protein
LVILEAGAPSYAVRYFATNVFLGEQNNRPGLLPALQCRGADGVLRVRVALKDASGLASCGGHPVPFALKRVRAKRPERSGAA